MAFIFEALKWTGLILLGLAAIALYAMGEASTYIGTKGRIPA